MHFGGNCCSGQSLAGRSLRAACQPRPHTLGRGRLQAAMPSWRACQQCEDRKTSQVYRYHKLDFLQPTIFIMFITKHAGLSRKDSRYLKLNNIEDSGQHVRCDN